MSENSYLFLPQTPIEVGHMDEAMASLTKAASSFLATPRSETTITRLQLKLYLVNTYSDVIGPLVSQATEIGTLEDLDLAILEEEEADDCYEEEMRQQARTVDGFFSAYPSVIHCLSKLELYNVCFAECDLHHLLFDCCKQLQHLSLHNCDAGGFSCWKIQAPDLKLSVLELDFCCLGKLEVLCLPKLEKLCWDTWIYPLTPLLLGVAPSLKELNLICAASFDHIGFKLSKVLMDTTSIQNLTLNFSGEKLWIKPEGKQLCTAFKKLRKLSLHGIFVEFDLLWMTVLLEAAPSVEIFDIEALLFYCFLFFIINVFPSQDKIWEHLCIVDTEDRRETFGERTNPSWNVAEFKSCKEWLLKEVQVTGFSPMEQQIALLRAVMQRASNLQTIVLKDYKRCDHCDDIGALPRCERLPPERVFPKGKVEQDAAVEQLIRDMPDCNVQIVFGN